MIIDLSGKQAKILPPDPGRSELSLCLPPLVTPPHLPPLATPDPEIELAESEGKKRNNNPAKISTICLGILFMWIMLVLIMHLDKKVSRC